MMDFNTVWNKICDEYAEDFGGISYRTAVKGYGCSNKPMTLFIEISKEDYDDSNFDVPFTNIKNWLYDNANTHEYRWDGETHHFNDFDVVIDVINE